MSRKIITLRFNGRNYYVYEGKEHLVTFCQEDFDKIVTIIGASRQNLYGMEMRVDSIKFIGLKDADINSEGYFISKDTHNTTPFDFCNRNPVDTWDIKRNFLSGEVTFNTLWLERVDGFKKMKAGDVKVFTRVEIRVSNIRKLY